MYTFPFNVGNKRCWCIQWACFLSLERNSFQPDNPWLLPCSTPSLRWDITFLKSNQILIRWSKIYSQQEAVCIQCICFVMAVVGSGWLSLQEDHWWTLPSLGSSSPDQVSWLVKVIYSSLRLTQEHISLFPTYHRDVGCDNRVDLHPAHGPFGVGGVRYADTDAAVLIHFLTLHPEQEELQVRDNVYLFLFTLSPFSRALSLPLHSLFLSQEHTRITHRHACVLSLPWLVCP